MIKVVVPSVGESITEVTISNWLKKDGDVVRMDEALCEVESDKATVEINAPSAGMLKIKTQAGTTVKIGEMVAEIDETKTASTAAPVETNTSNKSTNSQVSVAVNAEGSAHAQHHPSPAAKKILDEKGIDPKQVAGSGREGRITKEDALAAQTNQNNVTALKSSAVSPESSLGVRREKMSGLRKTIAKRLVAAKNQTAMLTTFNEIDMTEIMALRKRYKDTFKEKYQVNLGFMSLFTKASCVALKHFPAINAQIDGEEVIYFDSADVGIAVSTPKGLVVPVVRGAEHLSLAEIEKEILRLATKARDGKITVEDMSGGTFTITNGGVFGSMLSTPILNAPQSAILGMHNIVERPVAKNGQVVIAPIMYVALSYDHRLVDGRESVGFLKTIKELIEDPARLILEV